jgi:glycosyltransferase involved in cell wall biosynthesis
MADVSVVIPTYNRVSWVRRAVRSALRAGSDVEVIVVDDASTDETPEVCRAIEGIRYIRLPSNSGLASARNAGIDAASGEYVAFLDDDDERLPGSLDLQLARLRSNPAASFAYGQVLIGDAVTNRPTGEKRPHRTIDGDLFWRLLEGNFIYVPSTLASKRQLLEVGKFDCRWPALEDWHLWLRLAERHPVVAVDRPVAIYRTATAGSNQMSSDQARMSAISDLVREEALHLPRVLEAPACEPVALARYSRNHRSDRLIWTAAHSLQQGRPHAALRGLLEGLKVHPTRALRPWTVKLLLSSLRGAGSARSARRRRPGAAGFER